MTGTARASAAVGMLDPVTTYFWSETASSESLSELAAAGVVVAVVLVDWALTPTVSAEPAPKTRESAARNFLTECLFIV